jgi:hypothetical protein
MLKTHMLEQNSSVNLQPLTQLYLFPLQEKYVCIFHSTSLVQFYMISLIRFLFCFCWCFWLAKSIRLPTGEQKLQCQALSAFSQQVLLGWFRQNTFHSGLTRFGMVQWDGTRRSQSHLRLTAITKKVEIKCAFIFFFEGAQLKKLYDNVCYKSLWHINLRYAFRSK